MYAALLAGALATTFVTAAPYPTKHNITRYLFITGDSYTATGYNISLQPQPSYRHPLGNPVFPGVTFSGGENWVDVVVVNGSRNSSLPEARCTVAYNLAVGGNTVNVSQTTLTPADAPHPVADMIQQVDELELIFQRKTRGRKPDWNSENSLFMAWFGINDIFYNGIFAGSNRTLTAAKSYLKADISDYYKQFERLYELGARQFFTILVPPINRSPVVMALDKADLALNLTNYWNDEIRVQNQAFLTKHHDVETHFYDPNPIFNHILDHPHRYGANNNTCFSYPDGTPCLWHDFIHPGLVIQAHLGEEIFETIQNTGFFS